MEFKKKLREIKLIKDHRGIMISSAIDKDWTIILIYKIIVKIN